MSNTHTIKVPIKSISTSTYSHNYLSSLATQVMMMDGNELIIDMSDVEYIAANQFATLGCILDTHYRSSSERKILIRGLSGKLKNLIRINGFGQYVGLDKLPDKNNTVVPYKHFYVDEIEEYERYIMIHLLGRADLPLMTPEVRNNILDYLLEIFKNVKDHTTSTRIYTCGQFFPKSSMLFFTMVDAGETIPYNVNNYFEKHQKIGPKNTLEWALQEGHTTLDEDGPRGIGLSLIKSFISLNKGCFYIVSGKNAYEITQKGERYVELKSSFPGTIVTLAFNLKDDAIYYMDSGMIQEIEF